MNEVNSVAFDINYIAIKEKSIIEALNGINEKDLLSVLSERGREVYYKLKKLKQ